MKRLTCVLLILLMLIPAAGCGNLNEQPERMLHPVDYYFVRKDVTYGTQNGVLAVQTVDFGEVIPDLTAVLERYLTLPAPEGMELPFPPDTKLLSATYTNNTAALQISGAYADLSGIHATLADACIAKTVLAFTGAEKMQLTVCDTAGGLLRSKKISENDILFFDDSSDTSITTYTLYFTDDSGRYLMTERRTVPYLSDADLPKHLVTQLTEGPQTNGLVGTLPEGTRLLDINVENGVCAVDFSAEFLSNLPQDAAAERIAVMSVVNTLTVLDNIDQVQFYVEGNRMEQLRYLQISGQFVFDGTAIGPVRKDMNELDAAVYLPLEGSGLLYAIPARLKVASETPADAVLRLLSGYEPKNGLQNPLSGKPLPEDIRMDGQCCLLFYSEETVFGDTPETEADAVRVLAASLTALDGISSIRIFVNGKPAVLSVPDLPAIIRPSADWYCEQSE